MSVGGSSLQICCGGMVRFLSKSIYCPNEERGTIIIGVWRHKNGLSRDGKGGCNYHLKMQKCDRNGSGFSNRSIFLQGDCHLCFHFTIMSVVYFLLDDSIQFQCHKGFGNVSFPNCTRGAGRLGHGTMANIPSGKPEDPGSIQDSATCKLYDPGQVTEQFQPHFADLKSADKNSSPIFHRGFLRG